MAQIHLIYANDALHFAGALASGLQDEGFDCPWHEEHGSMTMDVADRAKDADSIIAFWTAPALHNKWVRDAAWIAFRRGKLIHVMLDPVTPPMGFGGSPPIDFSGWKGETKGPLWKALMNRVLATSGRPIGKLTWREYRDPLLPVATAVMASTLGLLMGATPPRETYLIASGGEASLMEENIAMGGLTASLPVEPASARFDADYLPIKIKVRTFAFESLDSGKDLGALADSGIGYSGWTKIEASGRAEDRAGPSL